MPVKDRDALAIAGQTGKAFWFSKAAGQFVTSSFYCDAYPDWLATWNDQDDAHRYLVGASYLLPTTIDPLS